MGPYGLHMDPKGSHMSPYGTHMGPYGIHMGPYDTIWELYGPIWSPCECHMGPYVLAWLCLILPGLAGFNSAQLGPSSGLLSPVLGKFVHAVRLKWVHWYFTN